LIDAVFKQSSPVDRQTRWICPYEKNANSKPSMKKKNLWAGWLNGARMMCLGK
jgi:hypothetical protein